MTGSIAVGPLGRLFAFLLTTAFLGAWSADVAGPPATPEPPTPPRERAEATLRFRLITPTGEARKIDDLVFTWKADDAEVRLLVHPEGRGDDGSSVSLASDLVARIPADEDGELRVFRPRPWRAPCPHEDVPFRRVEVTSLAPGETRTLAPIPMPLEPILVSGRVVDAEGRPIRTWVSITGTSTLGGGPSDRPCDYLGVMSDANGEFLLRRRSTWDRRYEISCSGTHHADARVFEEGATGLTLVVERTGHLQGMVTLGSELPANRLKILLRRQGEARPRPGVPGAHRLGRDLPPGVYTVEVRVMDWPVLELREVRIRPGETTAPPALRAFVADAGLRIGEVRVHDRDGLPLAGLDVLATPEGTTPGWREFLARGAVTDAEGRAVVAVPPGVGFEILTLRDAEDLTRTPFDGFPATVELGRP